MDLTIDRIEEGTAVLIGREDETVRISIPAGHLPPGSREGDVLTMTLERDDAATRAAKEKVSGLITRLRKS
jgi:hypothetical protein